MNTNTALKNTNKATDASPASSPVIAINNKLEAKMPSGPLSQLVVESEATARVASALDDVPLDVIRRVITRIYNEVQPTQTPIAPVKALVEVQPIAPGRKMFHGKPVQTPEERRANRAEYQRLYRERAAKAKAAKVAKKASKRSK